MSASVALALACVTLGSVVCAYWAGQANILHRFRKHHERKMERKLRWEEFDDED